MAVFYSNTRTASYRPGVAALLLAAASAAPFSVAEVIATDPVGYISTPAAGGAVGAPGLTFVSPSLANPVLWQGQVTAVNGATLTIDRADWQAGDFDSRHMLEIASGAYAGIWTAVVSTDANQLVVAEPLQSVLSGGETVRIRRFTTLSDFLGTYNETGLKSSASSITADTVTVYHASGIKNYWYYNGMQGGTAGWYTSGWVFAGDAVIAPGEGVIIQRKEQGALRIHQSGFVKSGPQTVVIEKSRNFVGGVAPAGLRLGESQLYTGDSVTGMAAGTSPVYADTVLIHANPTRTYWYYNGTQGGTAGWYDAGWRPANDVVIPAGSTFVIERKYNAPFVWFLPSATDSL